MPPAHQLDGVRLTRRDGSYRQSFEVENANRAMRLAGLGAPITVSLPDHNEDAAYSFQDGHLKVVSSRKFTPNVPFECTEGKFSFDDAPNPFNQMGALLEDNIPLVTSNDFESFLAAFGKRSNFVQQGKDDDISDAAFNEALAIIRDFKVPQAWSEWDENPEDRERWLSKFDIHKRRRMEKAYEELLEVDSKDLGQKDLSVKLEVLLKRNDETWAPRVIYAGTDAFNAVTGPVMMVFMERLVEALQKCSVGVVKVKLAYKTNDVSLAEFLDDPELPNTYEGDFSANDREQRSRVALLFDEWMCKLKLPQWTRTLFLEMDRYKVQNQRFGITAHLKYQLPTGTTSTTARNSTYNLTMFAVACARQHVTKAKACVLGDDILARTMQKFSVVLWKQTVDEDFKMKLKGKEPALNGQATLLSRRIIIDGDTKCMVPLIGKALARFNARASINEAVSDSQYMAGKSLSYAYEFRHVPYLRDRFLERYEMEDTAAVTLDDLTWFARTSGVDLSNLVQAIRDEKVLVSDGMFLDWLMETYDMGLCDVDELFQMVVLNKCPEIITHPAVAQLAIDW